MLVRWLPLIIGAAPLLAVHVAFLIAVEYGYLPACIPYLDGCTSISATGRYPPANLLFRAVEMPIAFALLMLWPFVVQWLRELDPALPARSAQAILVSGTAGALALIVYVTFLGTTMPVYEFMRRFGIYFYFLGTALAQVLTAVALRRASRPLRDPVLNGLCSALLCLCALPFVLGLLNLVLKASLADPDAVENGIEWTASLMMQVYFLVLFAAWRHTGFAVEATLRVRPRRD